MLLNVLLVVVIDLGNIFFGYVFFMRIDVNKDLLKSYIFCWQVLNGSLILFKILLIILLNNGVQFVVFGFEVEFIYVELLEDGKGEDYFYFFYFKMMFYGYVKIKVYIILQLIYNVI